MAIKKMKRFIKNIINKLRQNFLLKNTFLHSYKVQELFLQQNTPYGFNRLDIIVRLITIEAEQGQNPYGWDLYRKMQYARVGENQPISIEKRVENFKNLIHSWDEKGYDEKSVIIVDKNLHLIDGSHRIAMCLYHKQEFVNCYVSQDEINIPYGIDWFIQNGFTTEELSIITNRAKQLIAENKIYISCILWPPVAFYFDEIMEKISLEYKIVNSAEILYSDETFKKIVKAIYHIDDIADWKIDKKLDYFSPYNEKIIRFFQITLDKPQFRYKSSTKNLLLTQGETLKHIIRTCYSKKVDNYFFDIIFHTGDNVEQSEYIYRLFNPIFNLSTLFDILEPYNWMIIKLDTPYLPKNFPEMFPFSKDLDLICSSKDFSEIEKTITNYLKPIAEQYYDPIITNKDDGRILFRLELKGFLIYQIDLSMRVDGINNQFITNALDHKLRRDNFYTPKLEDELCFRINEYIHYPNKKYHLQYIIQHKDQIDIEKTLHFITGAQEALSEIQL